MDKLRIALVGCGHAGTRHAHAMALLKDKVELAAVCDPRTDKAADLARALGVPRHAADFAELVREPSFDAVSICGPNDMHAEIAIRAAREGLHVLVEKPMCTTLEEADAMLAAARQSGVLLMVAEPVRYDPLYTKILALLEQGAIGAPFLFRIAREHHMHAYFADKGWFLADLSGGIMYCGGIHDFDLLRLLGGEVEHVYALQARKSLASMKSDDTSVAMAGLASGAAGLIVESFSIRTEIRGVSGAIHGEEGTIRFHGDRVALYTHAEDGVPEALEEQRVQPKDLFAAEIEDFADCIEQGREPLSTAGNARQSLACVVAAYQSMRTGQRVEFSEL